MILQGKTAICRLI